MIKTPGCLFIISAPSGAGKTSLVRVLLQSGLNLSLSTSHTTRPPRNGEIDGRDYHFVTEQKFKQMLFDGEFVESAEVYGNLYGTSQHWLSETMSFGQDILLEIDCQGAKQIKQIFPHSIGIFILPPSVEALATRLKTRAQDNHEVIQKRLAAAREEISHVAEFDYVIVNSKLDEALNDLICIVKAERLRKERQMITYKALVTQLS
ncbi:guanylate kinase [Nitrosomonas supralitoralis]|uniref:Guanylate kinase n=1 Tax=Nitrosomonas supralitoralis TaxID=2116706 RepID=A0A2P7NYH2_9PROT|nr:guanylate kinase [Nitrosomonas supralitoralis]PSJ18511.1 guanylate kinase [Nitrosomonas supralitoralis]